MRFRPPWYRDTRIVKAASFWSDPPPPYDRETAEIADYEASEHSTAAAENLSVSGEMPAASPCAVTLPPFPEKPQWPYPGGVHEFGAWWGLSLISGHIGITRKT